MQTNDLPNYRFTAEIPRYRDTPQKVEMAYVIKGRGLSVTQGRSVNLVPWTSLRFLHLHVTSGVGTTGFPVCANGRNGRAKLPPRSHLSKCALERFLLTAD